MSLVGNVKVQDCKVRKSWSKMTYGPLKQSGGGNLVHKSAARGGIGKTPPGIKEVHESAIFGQSFPAF